MLTSKNYHIIIPARYGSTRLPGKLLLDVGGKTLLERVYDKALLCSANSITIATDSEEIKRAALGFGARVCMTGEHPNGTSRLAEASVKLGLGNNDIVINLQADEPLINTTLLDELAANLLNAEPNIGMYTLAAPILKIDDLLNPNVVKVVFDYNYQALLFSRAVIPHAIDSENKAVNNLQGYYRHLGVYAYRVRTLLTYANLKETLLERLECLEQLRFLWHGIAIKILITDEIMPAGVDTLEQLEAVRQCYKLMS